MTDELEGAPTNEKMSDADAKAQEQEAIDLTLLVAKVRNEALEEAAIAGSIACYVTHHGKLGDEVLNRIRSLKAPTT